MPIVERIFAGAVLFCFAVATTQSAQGPRCDNWAAHLVSTQGVVQVQYPGNTEWRPTQLGQTFCLGDRVRVQADSRAALELANDTILRLDQKTTLLLPRAATEDDFWVDLVEGAIHLLSRVKRSLEIRTPFVNAGLEGTEFVVRILEDQTIVSVLEGRVAVSNPLGQLSLTPGQTASASKNSPPVLRLEIRPEDTVHWALYYPLILDPAQSGVDRAVLEVQRALAVGRADQAGAQLDAVLATDPSNPRALALASIVALAQNATDQAVDFAERAVALAPGEISAHLALSYSRQARFDLTGAKAAVDAALAIDPDDAIAWARLAELWASLGDTDAALEAARRAVELAPKLSRTQSVLGFIALRRLDLDQATTAFETAIGLDPTDPLPRVGQALVKIRRGALTDGTRDLEIAVSLDPANSLVRSYLGKAYFEQKRDREAGVEFERAKQLDPLDPTPWLYDAPRQLAGNAPIVALRELEQSVALNDNRAVTRSRLLLDADRSARTADQGQVFRELGFERLIPGITAPSLTSDPASSAVHRLQANTTRPREQSARVSELLQWQLNAPLSTHLLPLQQTEANLVVTSAADLVASSGMEDSRLFSTDGPFLRFSGVAGANDLLSNDLIAGYQFGPAVVGLSQYHYEFDGYADNNDQTRDIYGASLQWQLSPATMLFAEYRDDDRDFGDLSLGYGEQDIARNFRTSIDSDRWRLGLRHHVGPDTTLLATLTGFNKTEEQTDRVSVPVPPFVPPTTNYIDSETDDDGWLGELQLIRRWAPGALVAGAGYYDSDSTLKTLAETKAEIPFLGSVTLNRLAIRNDTNTRHTNAYAYWSASVLEHLDYTLGLAYDDYDGPQLDRDQLSPKLGLIWHLTDGLQLRAAAARSLKRTLVAEQTIEPTQVAGFTQMFDDPNGTEARLYGIALDARVGPDLYLGAELRQRDLKVPFTDTSGADRRADWDEHLGSLYGYWTPTDRLALRAELLYEDLDYDKRVPRADKPWSTTSLETVQVPLSVTYSMPQGVTARATARWVDQDADLIQVAIPGQPRRFESDSFWIADLEFDYRLPKRYGRIAIGAQNLFDQDFGYQEPDLNHPTLARERTFYLRLKLAL